MRRGVLPLRPAGGVRAVRGGALPGALPRLAHRGPPRLRPARAGAAGPHAEHPRLDRAPAGAAGRRGGRLRRAAARALGRKEQARRRVRRLPPRGRGLLRHVGAPDKDAHRGDAIAAPAGGGAGPRGGVGGALPHRAVRGDGALLPAPGQRHGGPRAAARGARPRAARLRAQVRGALHNEKAAPRARGDAARGADGREVARLRHRAAALQRAQVHARGAHTHLCRGPEPNHRGHGHRHSAGGPPPPRRAGLHRLQRPCGKGLHRPRPLPLQPTTIWASNDPARKKRDPSGGPFFIYLRRSSRAWFGRRAGSGRAGRWCRGSGARRG